MNNYIKECIKQVHLAQDIFYSLYFGYLDLIIQPAQSSSFARVIMIYSMHEI